MSLRFIVLFAMIAFTSMVKADGIETVIKEFPFLAGWESCERLDKEGSPVYVFTRSVLKDYGYGENYPDSVWVGLILRPVYSATQNISYLEVLYQDQKYYKNGKEIPAGSVTYQAKFEALSLCEFLYAKNGLVFYNDEDRKVFKHWKEKEVGSSSVLAGPIYWSRLPERAGEFRFRFTGIYHFSIFEEQEERPFRIGLSAEMPAPSPGPVTVSTGPTVGLVAGYKENYLYTTYGYDGNKDSPFFGIEYWRQINNFVIGAGFTKGDGHGFHPRISVQYRVRF